MDDLWQVSPTGEMVTAPTPTNPDLKIIHTDLQLVNANLQIMIALLQKIATAAAVTVYTPEHG